MHPVSIPFGFPQTPTACQQQHQHLKQVIQQQEAEIAQLRSLLLEIMEQDNACSLRHDAIDYYRDLNNLQTKLDRLHRDLICEGGHCPSVQEKAACPDAYFGLSATTERHTTALAGEFSSIKAGCLQFLSGMMSLNLL